MKAIANRYKRGELVGVGFECDFAGVRCHAIAWENAHVERLRDHIEFIDGLIIDQCNVDVGCGGPLVLHLETKNAQAVDAIRDSLKEGQTAIIVPAIDSIAEYTEPLKARIAELESELAIARAFVNFPKESTPIVDAVIPEFTEPPIIIQESEPFPLVEMSEVIATHETIEPAISETPVEPIQEPVVEVSELTASPPPQAVDTPVAVEVAPVEESPEVAEEVIEEAVEEAWKPTPGESEAQTIRSYFKQFGIATPHKQVIEALSAFGIEVTSSQVLMAKKAIKQ